MSLVSFRVFKEMARRPLADESRGKGGENSSDVSRRPLNIDNEAIAFLTQRDDSGRPGDHDPIDHDFWSKAQHERQKIFVSKILPKLQKAVDAKVRDSGLEPAVFHYLKYGKQLSTKPLSKEIVDYINQEYDVEEGRGVKVPTALPSTTRELISGIEKTLKGLDAVRNDYIITKEQRKQIEDLLEEAKSLDRSGDERSFLALRDKLAPVFSSLKRDYRLESYTESLLYEIFRKSTVDSKKFWEDNGLEDPITLVFKDARKSVSPRAQVRPYFFRLYHNYERTAGTPHLDELSMILGKVGQYGLDLKHPINLGDEEDPKVSTLGASFGDKTTNSAKHDEFVRKWFRHHSHGHFGDHIGSFSEKAVWRPVIVAGKEVEDPLFDWMHKSITKQIEKNLKDFIKVKTKDGEKATYADLDFGEESARFLDKDGTLKTISSLSMGVVSLFAYEKAKEILIKAVKEGKLIAPPVPCTEESRKGKYICPTKEDRTYKVCKVCDGSGKSASPRGKRNQCGECGGDGVIKPSVYIPQENVKGKWIPLVNASTYMRRIDPDKEQEAHQEALEAVKELMGDHFGAESIDYEIPYSGGVTQKANFPTWTSHQIDPNSLNMGESDFETFGRTFNKNTTTRQFVDPNSVQGKEIIAKYLQREEDALIPIGNQRGRYPAVKDFIRGIQTCLTGGARSGSGCGGAPGVILKTLVNSMRDVHNIIYYQAMDSLLQMLPDPNKVVINKDGEEQDNTRASFAASKTSLLAQNLLDAKTGDKIDVEGGGTHTRRKGTRLVGNIAQGEDGEQADFDDKGYAGSDSKRGRGLPTGSGLNKHDRQKRVAELFARMNLTSQELQSVISKAEDAEAQTNMAMKSVAPDEQDPMRPLLDRLKIARNKREEFDEALIRLLSTPKEAGGLGKPQEEAVAMVTNFKDDSMEDIIRIIKQVSGASPAPKTIVQKPSARPMATGRNLIRDRLSSLKRSQQQAQQTVDPQQTPPPVQPGAEEKVDWRVLDGLNISEKVEYLKRKLRG